MLGGVFEGLVDGMSATTKMHFTFLVIASFFALNFMMLKKNRVKRRKYPPNINGFSADYSTLNTLHISYKLSRGPYSIEIHPEYPMSYAGNPKVNVKVEVDEAIKKFKPERGITYFTKIVFTGKINEILDDLSYDLKERYGLVNIDKREKDISHIYLMKRFTIPSIRKLAMYLSEKCPAYEFEINEDVNILETTDDAQYSLNS